MEFNLGDMQPIFTDPGPRAITIRKVVYNSVLKRFIAVGQGWVNSDNTGGWGNLGTTSFGPKVGDALGINFINKWTSSNGLTMWATFSSDGVRKLECVPHTFGWHEHGFV
jgi:hypothetical protein